ncbi:MAG: hypothetical protein Terrestrivirus6_67 [Terrestrivirus sp.]|uniref:EamA domain-containing protein n=1 Tax=Terrestrivirus sp. TaxID=2487775 RepID=A0A3G4ZR28_9VIRU|nr:MAG: hypothetical protein Terrestrivirus6_67 [Terrestrivirus sp.]
MNSEKTKNSLIIFILVILAVILSASAQFYARKFHDTKNITDYIISGAFFCLSLIMFFYAYQQGDVYAINNLFTSISIVLLYAVGYYFFNEEITPLEITAVIIIIGGIFVTYL